MVKKDGTLFDARLEMSLITPEQIQPGQLRVVIIDVTESKRLETQLQYHQKHLEELVQQRTTELSEVKDKFQFITESMVDIVWMMDMDLRVTYVSPSVERVMGYSPEERRGKTMDDIVTPESLQKTQQTYAAELQKEREGTEAPDRNIILELEYFKKDGATIWLENNIRGVRDSKGMLVGLHGVARDVTDRKTYELALRNSEERFALAMDAANEGVWDWDLRTDNIYRSPNFYRMLGYEPSDFQPGFEAWRQKVHQDDTGKTLKALDDYFEGRTEKYEVEFRMLDIHGKPVWTLSKGEVVARDENGTPTRMVGTHIDITARKSLEAQLMQSQKMEAVGTLAAGIAHDFNNMLQGILGYSELLLNEKSKGEHGYAELQRIVKISLEAKDLVQKIRLFSRKADIQPVALDLNHQLIDLTKLLSHTLLKTIKIDVHPAEHLGTIQADPALMDQMVTNLAINASEAMPEGGTLTIETENTLLDDDYCKSHVGAKPGPHVVLSISDTGRGMTREFLDRIFDPFFSTKQRDFHRGTGLGLSIVKGIVDEHDGYITVESEVGKGTTFKIYFSILTTRRTPKAEALVDVSIIPGSETILLVEDEELVRDLGIMFLERFGYTVIAVSDGNEALEVYAREQKNIALIILDIVMPRMDGRVCLQELLKINPAVKVLISSGVAQDDRVMEVVDLGAKGLLLKPYGMKALQEKVREVLDADCC